MNRFISSMARPEESSTEVGAAADGQRNASRQLRADLARAVDANLDLVRKAFDLYAGAVERLLGSDRASSGHHDGSHLKLPPVLPGHRASSTLWIHNTTSSASPTLRIHASDLVSHTGETISSEAFCFEPSEIDIAPPGSTLAVAVDLTIDPAVAPGSYRGHVFVANLPAEYLTVEVEVVGPVGRDQKQPWPDHQQAS
ncbi:MAG: hypothetical protein ACRDWH_03695 [Acidimicrobiia bacterium]